MMPDSEISIFEQVVEIACHYYGNSAPIAIVVDTEGIDNNVRFHGTWQIQSCSTKEETETSVLACLANTPVLLLPPLTASRGKGRKWPFEELMSGLGSSNSVMPLVLILPDSFLGSDQDRHLRQKLAESWNIELIVTGTSLYKGTHPQFRMAAIFLTKRAKKEPIKFFSLPTVSTPASEIEQDFRHLMRKNSGRGRFGYVAQETVIPAESLWPDRYDPKLLDQRDNLKSFGTLTKLVDLFEVRLGPVHLAAHADLINTVPEFNSARLLMGRDIRQGAVTLPDEPIWVQAEPDWYLQEGDIAVRAITRFSDHGGLEAAEVAEVDLPLVASHHVIVLRPKPSTDHLQRRIVLQLLRMPLARRLVFSTGNLLHLRLRSLMELPVPQLSEDLRSVLENLENARTRFEIWRDECERLLNSVFEGDTPAAARLRLLASGRKIRLRSNAAAALDDTHHVFRTQLPYPIAHRWRLMEAMSSAGPSREAYLMVLDVAEILACYAALIGLTLARSAGVSIGYAQNIRNTLNQGKNGPGLGDWIAILREIRDSKAVRGQVAVKPLSDMRLLLAKTSTDDALQALAHRRNDEAHQRRISTGATPAALNEAFNELTSLMKGSLFLAELPLVRISTLHWDTFSRRAVVQYQEFMGDHPVVRTQTMTYHTNDLEAESLYILDDRRNLHLLRPYLIGLNCPLCHEWSTFHVDGMAGSSPKFKSLEHGHVFEAPELLEPLKHVGLL